jgi:glycosyltransferase involved in cell wall biosynthesis
MRNSAAHADICLILEGTYPYAKGGVSSWTHDLILMQPHLTFHVVALVAPDADLTMAYELPTNVLGMTIIKLQKLPQPTARLSTADQQRLLHTLQTVLPALAGDVNAASFASLVQLLRQHQTALGSAQLLDSQEIWELIVAMYRQSQPLSPFLDYYWSWRGVFSGLFSILLAELPSAKVYHAISTGYAGLLLARAKEKTGRPCLITEHGIYNNERRIEIASAAWLEDSRDRNLQIAGRSQDIKDFWISVFESYAKLAYSAADEIITLFYDNQSFQIADGAPEEKLRVIPNGIDVGRYQAITRSAEHPPTVALIGRVVPIKDIKTFIKAVAQLVQTMPDLHALVIGSAAEDPDYAAECNGLVNYYNVQHKLTFTGAVRLEDYLGYIDVIALTSISESQPLVILEAGSLGIPCVATDVGSCRELLEGRGDEDPPLGAGGIIVPLVDPTATAAALGQLLQNRVFYKCCSRAIRDRVQRYYSKEDQQRSYAELYARHINRAAALNPALAEQAATASSSNAQEHV